MNIILLCGSFIIIILQAENVRYAVDGRTQIRVKNYIATRLDRIF